MKKLLAVLLGFTLAFSLTACGDKESEVFVDPLTSVATAREKATEAITTEVNVAVDVIGVVSAIHYSSYNGALSENGIYLTDATGTIYVYGFAVAQEVEIGDEIEISAVTANYYGAIQLSGPSLTRVINTGVEVSMASVIKDKTLTDIGNLTVANAGEMYEVSATVSVNSYGSYSLTDADGGYFGLYASGTRDGDSPLGYPEFAFLDAYKEKTGKFVIVINGTSTSGSLRGHVIKIVE